MFNIFKKKKKKIKKPFICTHTEYYGLTNLCKKYGCPDDPNWRGDGCK